MSSSITFLNGHSWAGAGWLYGSIINELCGYLEGQDADIKTLLQSDSELAQLVGMIDLTDDGTWPPARSKRFEEVLLLMINQFQRHGLRFTTLQNHRAEEIFSQTLVTLKEHIESEGVLP